MKPIAIISSIALTITATQAATTIFSEDFDTLTTATALSGQGGWTHSGSNNNTTVETDPGSFGFSGNIAQNAGGDTQTRKAISGLDDTNIMTASMDLRINGDLTYTYWLLGSSASLGIERQNMTLREAEGGTQTFDHNLSGDNTYRMTLTIDPTAFSGAGSATVTYAQYTAENTLGASSTAFSNVELRLDESNRALSDISTGILRIHAGNTGRVDNLLITQVPEPSAFALLGLGGLAFARRRRS